uniref:Uncharacterized protein n=1 Tax=Leersia perrieri TaxID=77586 RepID=A0A0D9XAB9_9ORYZ
MEGKVDHPDLGLRYGLAVDVKSIHELLQRQMSVLVLVHEVEHLHVLVQLLHRQIPRHHLHQRRDAGEEDVKDDAGAPDVHLRAVASFQNLRRHDMRRAWLEEDGEAEVDDLERRILRFIGEQEILRLQIPVDHPSSPPSQSSITRCTPPPPPPPSAATSSHASRSRTTDDDADDIRLMIATSLLTSSPSFAAGVAFAARRRLRPRWRRMVLQASDSPVAASRHRRVTPNSPRPSSRPSTYRRANSAAVVVAMTSSMTTTSAACSSSFLGEASEGSGRTRLMRARSLREDA